MEKIIIFVLFYLFVDARFKENLNRDPGIPRLNNNPIKVEDLPTELLWNDYKGVNYLTLTRN